MSFPAFYGEVMEPSSRAVDEEEDEEDADVEGFGESVLRWSPAALSEIEESGCISCNILCMAIGMTATGFSQTNFLKGEELETLAVICTGLSDDELHSVSQKAPTDKTCYVYRMKERPTFLFCQCKATVSPDQSFSWVEKLLSKLSRSSLYVSVLDSRHISNYVSNQSHSELTLPLLRALKSEEFRGTPVCPFLEQPNVVEGLAAQILTYCQVKRLASVLYICYTETMFLEVASMKEFSRILTVTPFKDVFKPNPNETKEMESMVEKTMEGQYLYV